MREPQSLREPWNALSWGSHPARWQVPGLSGLCPEPGPGGHHLCAAGRAARKQQWPALLCCVIHSNSLPTPRPQSAHLQNGQGSGKDRRGWWGMRAPQGPGWGSG